MTTWKQITSLINGGPTDGICTCGYGMDQIRKGNLVHMFSDEWIAERDKRNALPREGG